MNNNNNNIDNNDNTNGTLFDDCKAGYLDGVIDKINDGSDINMIYNDDNETPLWISCNKGHLEIVEILIAKEHW